MLISQQVRTKKLFRTILLVLYWLFCGANLVSLGNVSFAGDKIEQTTLADVRIRRLPEDNGIADMLCKLVGLMQSDITRALVAFSLFSAGIGAFFGKLTLGWFFSFVVGASVFFGSIQMLSFFAPYSDVGMGCKCKEYMIVAQKDDGKGYVKVSSKLTKDCKRLDNPNDAADTMV